jgi:hypothetical protein
MVDFLADRIDAIHDQPKVSADVCAHPDDVAGILRDAWVDEDDSERG